MQKVIAWMEIAGFPFDDTTAWDEIDEGHGSGRGSGSGPDDGTSGWTSGDSPSNLSLITNLSSVTDPASSTNHIYRGRSLKYSNGSGAQIDITMRLLENGTQRATQTFTNIGGAWTTRAVTLTAGEADAITNYGLLEIDTQANKVGGGAPRSARESAQEFECPDAGAAPNNKFLLQPF